MTGYVKIDPRDNLTREEVEEIAGGVADHETWMTSASFLLTAAARLEPEIEGYWKSYNFLTGETNGKAESAQILQIVYNMLTGLAIENILKAGIVRRDPAKAFSEAASTRRIPQFLKSHDLVKLAKACDVEISERENNVLEHLTKSILWSGRYPFPIELKESTGWATTVGEIENAKACIGKLCKHLGLEAPRIL